MESSKIFSQLCNIIFPFTDFMYLLQQEEYSLQRIWFWLPRFFFRRNVQKRDKLVYTKRTKTTLAVSIGLFLVACGIISLHVHYFPLVPLLILCIFIPLFVLLANTLVSPIYGYLKKRTIARATDYFKKTRGAVKVVAITGSYGKTTVKNSIEQLVKASFKTQMIPGNINSTIGIANWILKDFKKGTEVLIVEMDSYKPKRITASANLVMPDIAILTNIGDQHLQRYKTRENLARSLFELFEAVPTGVVKITDIETKNYLESLHLRTSDIGTIPPGTHHDSFSQSHNENIKYAMRVAKLLGVPQEYIDHVSLKIILPERRQSHATIAGFEGIDDSYNISFVTGSAGIIEAKRQATKSNKKLVVIAAGIPELGPGEEDKNIQLGKLLEEKADSVILLDSIFAQDIARGITTKDKVHIYKNFKVAIQALRDQYQPDEWFVLQQPELTDLYY